MRRTGGFTLIEMLVATAVFVVGFVAVFGLFLAGVRFRKLSEDTAFGALAASSLVCEIGIDAGREIGAPKMPKDYLGSGFASGGTGDTPDRLYRYRGQHGIWYRVVLASDLTGDPNNAEATSIKMRILVVPWASNQDDATFGLSGIVQRLHLDPTLTPDQIATELIKRGLARSYDTVIVRRASWLAAVGGPSS